MRSPAASPAAPEPARHRVRERIEIAEAHFARLRGLVQIDDRRARVLGAVRKEFAEITGIAAGLGEGDRHQGGGLLERE